MKLYAGDAPASPLPVGCAARIMTGAPLPEGADCVLMQELTDSGEETVQLYAAMKPQQNVVFRGGDIAAGAVIAEAGTVLSPAHLGVLAGQGYAEVPVYKTLTVGVLATGSELLAPGEAWTPGKIYDANGVQNAARLRQLGFAVNRRHCSDDPEEIAREMRELLAECDAVITSGGVSVGQKDYLPAVLEQLNADILFAGVAQKPEAPCWPGKLTASWCSACPATPLLPPPRWNNMPPRLFCGRGALRGKLHPSPHHPHPDHGLLEVQQGEPLSAGQSHGRQRDHPRRGQRRSPLVRQPFCHDRLQLSR